MIHTMSLFCRLTRREYDSFMELHKGSYWRDVGWIDDTHKDDGVMVKVRKHVCNEFNRYYAYATVVLAKVVHGRSTVEVFNGASAGVFKENFNAIMKDIGLPALSLWMVRRIDYCVNVHLGDSEAVKLYERLLKHGDIPNNLIRPEDEACTRTHRDGSLYLVPPTDYKKKSVSINFYDKQDEYKSKGASAELVSISGGVLRLEVQCHRAKVKRIIKKYDLDGSVESFFSHTICEDVICHYANIIAKKGDYYRKSEVIGQLQSCSSQPDTKQAMIDLATEVSRQRGSIVKYKMQHREDSKRIDSLLSKFNKYGINPVYIPDSTVLSGRFRRTPLPSLDSLVRLAIREEIDLENRIDADWNTIEEIQFYKVFEDDDIISKEELKELFKESKRQEKKRVIA